ncbi:MAG: histidine kinase [Candidatus Eisenbacteria bacterium]
MTEQREESARAGRVRETVRGLAVWVGANSVAGALVGFAVAIFSNEPGAMERFVLMGVLLGNAIGFAAVLSARFVLPRYGPLPTYVRVPLAALTLLAGGAFGSALVLLFYPLMVFYQARLLAMLLIVNGVVALIVGLLVYNYERLRNEIEAGYRALSENRVREERLRELAARSELKALKAQINPHFLFNALNSISALIATDPSSAERTLERLAGTFRGTLLASEKESVPLRTELELVDAYLDIERARFGERLTVRHAIAPEALDAQVPPLILQPLVENAVRHGISPRVEGGTVSIEARVDGGTLRVTVEDDGPGMAGSDTELAMSRGFGLRNVRDRLATRFGDLASFTLESEGGVRVALAIPVVSGGPAPMGSDGDEERTR